MTSVRRPSVQIPEVRSQQRVDGFETPRIDPVQQQEQAREQHERMRTSGRFPAIAPIQDNVVRDDGFPYLARDPRRPGTQPVTSTDTNNTVSPNRSTVSAQRPDLSGAQVFGRPVETNSSHDLFWHYFGSRPSPQTNDEARAMMAEMQEKFAPFGFKVEPIEHQRMDKITITGPDGKKEVVDFIFAMGGERGQQRLQWLAGDATPPGQSGTVDQNFVGMWLTMFEPTNEGMRKALAKLREQPGYENTELLEHPRRLDKLRFPNGQVVDVIIGAGGPNPSWGWLPE